MIDYLSPYSAKGQWLAPINGKYLGMSSNGPKLEDIDTWHQMIIDGLKTQTEDFINTRTSSLFCIGNIIKIHLTMNTFSKENFIILTENPMIAIYD